MPATYEKIATTTLGSASATITFSSIAASWTDLRLVFVGTWTAANAFRFRINNDATALYSYTPLQGDGATATSLRTTGATSFQTASNSSTTSPTFFTIDLFSYAGSTNKTCLAQISQDQNGAGTVESDVVLYRSTTAITRLDLLCVGTTWQTGTTATLYGILKA